MLIDDRREVCPGGQQLVEADGFGFVRQRICGRAAE